MPPYESIVQLQNLSKRDNNEETAGVFGEHI